MLRPHAYKKVKYEKENPLSSEQKTIEREINYIPVRYIFAVLITVIEILSIIGIVIALCIYVPYFYILALLTEIGCVVKIVASDDNPDYKVPCLLFVLALPIAGFMLYFLFSSRKLQKKYVKRFTQAKELGYQQDDSPAFSALKAENPVAFCQAKMLCDISESHLFTDTAQRYFSVGEEMWESLLSDLKTVEKFIYMEYFIIEQGKFWGSILDILKEKAQNGVWLYDCDCIEDIKRTLRRLWHRAWR